VVLLLSRFFFGCAAACMSCVTKKTLTELLFILRVLSQNVGNCFHVLFMGLSLVWNIGDVDEWIFACVRQSTAKRVNFHSKKLIALVHMFSTLHFFGGGESWNSIGYCQS
jgi:hypothetical protein